MSYHNTMRAMDVDDDSVFIRDDTEIPNAREEKTKAVSSKQIGKVGVEKVDKQQLRREQLAAFREEKKKIENAKRKMSKPAFKVGIVHHPLTPFPDKESKTNVFSTTSGKALVKDSTSKAKNSARKVSRSIRRSIGGSRRK